MINATVPTLPNYDDRVTKPSARGSGDMVFEIFWYELLAKLVTYLNALQAEPLVRTQADLGRFALKFGPAQRGILVFVSDFNHALMWAGSGWDYAPGDSGSGWYADFDAASPPSGTGWALCDGSTVDCLQSDGGVVSVTLPTTANRYFRI